MIEAKPFRCSRHRLATDSARALGLGALAVALALGAPRLALAEYVNFEAGPVRPLALSPNGDHLFAVNTPDNHLAVFARSDEGLELLVDVPVGLRPVAVAVRSIGGDVLEAWVVNHLSDSVSIVEIDPGDPGRARVTRTLHVGDEPRDIVFAGAGGRYAFVTTARRGQAEAAPPADTRVSGTPRALVWVFDVADPGEGIGGTPVRILELFADTPRALAVNPEGTVVYAAAFRSGNGSTVLPNTAVGSGGGLPPMPVGATPGWPLTGLIVKHDATSGEWNDEVERNWGPRVPFSLPDLDVFAIDATLDPPAPRKTGSHIARVGTTLFNMAVRPDTGKVYVSNLEARNHVRFVGFTGEEQGLRGRAIDNRISVLDGALGGDPLIVPLNPHVDPSVPTGDAAEIARSLAMPLEMVFGDGGATLYVAAFGSSKVAVLDADDLEKGEIGTDRIEVAGGPSGLALDEDGDRLYVMSRFAHGISIIEHPADPETRKNLGVVDLASPEPAVVRNGREHLYDARASGHGDAACGSCHLFGDMDKLAWDLGDPFGDVTPSPNPGINVPFLGNGATFHPLKGPMTTQSLRGLIGQGPLHWRGDKTNAAAPLDVPRDFEEFASAFVELLGRDEEIPEADFAAFRDFVMTLRYPPNPIQRLTGANSQQSSGENVFRNHNTVIVFTCNDCHALPTGTAGESMHLGIIGIDQNMKVPHLRNMYDKVGAYESGNDEVSGFGFLHDGSDYSMKRFLSLGVFSFGTGQRDQVDDFMMVVDTGLDPMVGQQVSLTATSHENPAALDRIALMQTRAEASACDLIVKGMSGERAFGGLYEGQGVFALDVVGEQTTSESLFAQAATAGHEQVFTCVPPGAGERMAVDRDGDGVWDGEDNCPSHANPGQLDRDDDGRGDPCDTVTVPEPAAGALQMTLLVGLALRAARRRSTDR